MRDTRRHAVNIVERLDAAFDDSILTASSQQPFPFNNPQE
jgi:hypothetical protein